MHNVLRMIKIAQRELLFKKIGLWENPPDIAISAKDFMFPKGLLKEYSRVFAFILRSLDFFAICLAGWIAFYLKFNQSQPTNLYLIAIILGALLSMAVFPFFDIYSSNGSRGFGAYALNLSQAFSVLAIILAGAAFFTKTGESFSRAWFAIWVLLAIVILISYRLVFLSLLRLMRARGWNERWVVIMGAGDLGLRLAETVQQSLWTGFRIVAFFDDCIENKQPYYHHIPVKQTPKQLSQFLGKHQIDEVWLALPLRAEARVKEVLHELRHLTVTTRFVLDIFGLELLNHSLSNLAGFSVLNIRSSPMVGIKRLIKACEDRMFAAFILLLISPILALIAIAVKMSSPGPVFYRQKRIGWNGKEFNMLKFRTMPVSAEASTGPVWAKPDENRATFLGAFLRRTSLDELPQFINVLKGEMSIVGPRPERPFFVEQFKEKVPRYMQKHYVKAGITGWAQVNGWRGDTSLEKRIEYDLFYIENWSLLFDLKIIFLTFLHGFINRNAY